MLGAILWESLDKEDEVLLARGVLDARVAEPTPFKGLE
jgi:hypothetical protein